MITKNTPFNNYRNLKYYDLISLKTLNLKIVKKRIKDGLGGTMGVYMNYKEIEKVRIKGFAQGYEKACMEHCWEECKEKNFEDSNGK